MPGGKSPLTFHLSSCNATEEASGGLKIGRLVNHGSAKERNAKMKVVITNDQPILCLFEIKAIEDRAAEVLYDYGIPESQLPRYKRGVSTIFNSVNNLCKNVKDEQ